MPRRRSSARLAATGLALAAGLGSGRAAAYCRTSACGDQPGTLCTPASPDDCGIPLFWASSCVGFSVQQDASRQVDFATAQTLVSEAFATWSTAPCDGGGTPSISARNLGPVACNQHEYNQTQGNANAIIFRDDSWPYSGQGHTLALTTVTYDLDTGEIYDADLEVNSTSNVPLTTGDTGVQYDLLSILTHETGHFLGLSHSPDPEATMFVQYVPGDTSLRSLAPDDIAAICDAYPPSSKRTCDPTPRRGFMSDCSQPPDKGCGCSLTPAPSRPVYLLLAAALLALLRRRR